MKLFAAALALAPFAQARLGSNQETMKSTAVVSIDGLKRALSPEDLSVIEKSAVGAYELAFKTTDFSLESFTFGEASDISNGEITIKGSTERCLTESCKNNHVKLGYRNWEICQIIPWACTGYCRLCPNDDDVEVTVDDLHHAFEDTFCAIIRDSGNYNFEHVENCSFKFVEVDDEDPASHGATLSINGVGKALTADDMSIVTKSTIAAYNVAFSKSDNSLQGLKLHPATISEGKAVFTGIADRCFNEECGEKLGYRNWETCQIIPWACTGYCRLCPNDDDVAELTMEDKHQIFEETLCKFLQASDSASLKHASDCALTFAKEAHEADEPVSTGAVASISGVTHKLTSKDLDVVKTSAIGAFKAAFESTEYSLADISFKPVASDDGKLVLVGEASRCLTDSCKNNHKLGYRNWEICQIIPWACTGYCRLCPNDDDIDVTMDDLHRAFEDAFCNTLRGSGSAVFKEAHDCVVNFDFGAVSSA